MIPEDLKYTREHEWARVEGNIVTMGITDHAQEQLGDIVFLELPATGEEVRQNQPLGEIESTKAVSDIFAAVSGTITEINEDLKASPELLNKDPYDEGWLVQIEMSDPGELKELMSAEQYAKFLEEEG